MKLFVKAEEIQGKFAESAMEAVRCCRRSKFSKQFAILTVMLGSASVALYNSTDVLKSHRIICLHTCTESFQTDALGMLNTKKMSQRLAQLFPLHCLEQPGTSCLAFSVGATLQSLRTGIENVKKKEEKEKEKKLSGAKSRKYGRNCFT